MILDKPRIKGPRLGATANGKWHHLLVCDYCLYPLTIPTNVTPVFDSAGNLIHSWNSDLLDISLCQGCGSEVARIKRDTGINNIRGAKFVSAKIHTDYRWYNPFSWFRGAEWEIRELSQEIQSSQGKTDDP